MDRTQKPLDGRIGARCFRGGGGGGTKVELAATTRLMQARKCSSGILGMETVLVEWCIRFACSFGRKSRI